MPAMVRLRRLRTLSLRSRLMIVGTLGVAGALLVGAAVLYVALWATGLRSLDNDADATASQVGLLVRSHQLPDPIPVTGTPIVQVLDESNRVVSASVTADRMTALLEPAEVQAALRGALTVSGSRDGLEGELRVHATAIAGTHDVVIVAQSTRSLDSSLYFLRIALLVSFPLVLAGMALVAWRVIGAALRPVEKLRASAESISGSQAAERLEVPVAGDEIRALALTLNAMLDRLASAQDRQRDFVADVAHELRSPLASMRAELEVAQHLDEGGPIVTALHADVVRMGLLIEDLLVLARADVGVSKTTQTSATGSVASVLETLRQHYSGRSVAITGSVSRDVAMEAQHLERVLMNLVDNAIRHARSSVSVSVRSGPGSATIYVDDDGPGIRPEDRDRVWLRFTRLDEARGRDDGGTGLGLAIVAELLRLSGGSATLTDRPGGGLRVVVEVPLVRDRGR